MFLRTSASVASAKRNTGDWISYLLRMPASCRLASASCLRSSSIAFDQKHGALRSSASITGALSFRHPCLLWGKLRQRACQFITYPRYLKGNYCGTLCQEEPISLPEFANHPLFRRNVGLEPLYLLPKQLQGAASSGLLQRMLLVDVAGVRARSPPWPQDRDRAPRTLCPS